MRADVNRIDGDHFRLRLAELKDPAVQVKHGVGAVDAVLSRGDLLSLRRRVDDALRMADAEDAGF